MRSIEGTSPCARRCGRPSACRARSHCVPSRGRDRSSAARSGRCTPRRGRRTLNARPSRAVGIVRIAPPSCRSLAGSRRRAASRALDRRCARRRSRAKPAPRPRADRVITRPSGCDEQGAALDRSPRERRTRTLARGPPPTSCERFVLLDGALCRRASGLDRAHGRRSGPIPAISASRGPNARGGSRRRRTLPIGCAAPSAWSTRLSRNSASTR